MRNSIFFSSRGDVGTLLGPSCGNLSRLTDLSPPPPSLLFYTSTYFVVIGLSDVFSQIASLVITWNILRSNMYFTSSALAPRTSH